MSERIDTIGDLLAGNPVHPGEGEASRPAPPIMPPKLDGQPDFPAPGIYFGMPEDQYHAIHAFSGSGAKKLGISSMDYWADSPLNPARISSDGDSIFKMLGRAYHVRICEGADAYAERYAVSLDKRGYGDDLLQSTEQIDAAIRETGHEPVSRIETGQMKTHAKTGAQSPVTRAARKDDLIRQLLDIAPDALVWDAMVAAHAEANAGKIQIDAIQDQRIAIAARMIESDPDLRKAFTNGFAEVAVFWFDHATGCPMKAKMDFLKVATISDLKSFSNAQERQIDRAIDYTISNQKHFIGCVVYTEAVAAAKALIRQHGASVIHWSGPDEDGEAMRPEIESFGFRLAQQEDQPKLLWIYQQTGAAPVTRGRIHPRNGVYAATQAHIDAMKRFWIANVEVYGSDPWLDIRPIRETTDENIPFAATDFGTE